MVRNGEGVAAVETGDLEVTVTKDCRQVVLPNGKNLTVTLQPLLVSEPELDGDEVLTYRIEIHIDQRWNGQSVESCTETFRYVQEEHVRSFMSALRVLLYLLGLRSDEINLPDVDQFSHLFARQNGA